jgi:uncharacterized protein (TIGR02679 family)
VTLPAWLSSPELQPLWQLVHDRLEQRGTAWRGRASLDVGTAGQAKVLGSLLGRVLAPERLSIDVADLDDRLANAGGVVAVVETAVGPVRDRRSARERAAAEREAPVRVAREVLGERPWAAPWLPQWLAAVRRSGPTVEQGRVAAALLARLLEAKGVVSRQDLAAEAAGDAHALDDGTVLAGLVLRGLAMAAGVAAPEQAAARPALWVQAGVALDSVSATCLVRGLRLAPGRLATRLADGHPLHVTARDLRAQELVAVPEQPVLVCENPRVLEAVTDARADLAVVCTNGNPNLVVMDVLQALQRAGAQLRYHGDFDWGGLTIANRVVAAVGASPWLMTAADYRQVVERGSLPLRGRAVEACWDPDLTTTMTGYGVAVHEEAVLPELLAALGC